MKYVGVTYDSGLWDGDLTGLLVLEKEDKTWEVAHSHISSTERFSESDVKAAFDRKSAEGDTFEWLGKKTKAAVKELFGWEA